MSACVTGEEGVGNRDLNRKSDWDVEVGNDLLLFMLISLTFHSTLSWFIRLHRNPITFL